jgi:ABC-type lipoprotein release transport system permease subunit
MGGVWLWARADLRQRWASTIVLMLLIGLVSAVVLTGIAGARRASSSFDRFLAESLAADVYVFPGEVTPQQVREFARAPYIAAVAAAQELQVQLPDGGFLAAGAPVDARFGTVVERPRILEGRAADPRSASEIVIAEPLARRQGLRVDDTLALYSFTPAQVDALRSGASLPEPGGPELRLRVVGISRLPSDLSLSGTQGGILIFTRAFAERYTTEIGSYVGDVLAVRLRNGAADVPRFVRRARAFFGRAETFEVQPLGLSTAGVQQSVDLLALGAAIFAAVAAIAGLTATTLVLRRRIGASATDQEVLSALGLTHAERSLAAGVPTVPTALLGALFGVLGAWLVSPLLPMGLARKAEPDPGLHFDGFALGVGFTAIVAVLLVVIAVIAWRSARVRPTGDAAPRRPTAAARASARLGLGPAASIGVRMALESGGRRVGVPVRSALVGTVAAVLGVTGVVVFGTSLQRLETTPARFGFNWDARVIDGAIEPSVPGHLCTVERSRLTAVRGVADVANICSFNAVLGGRPIVAFGVTPLRGTIEPTIVAGRAPRTPGEVALGSHTLEALGRGIGDRVPGTGPNGPVDYRIVGTAAAPRFNDDFSDPVPVDDGAFFTGAGLDALDDPTNTESSAETLIRVARSADREAVLRRVERLRGVSSFSGGPGVGRAVAPLEVERLQQIDSLPVLLAAFLALLGIVSVGFALASSVRRRSRDLAILKTLGFSRRQVSTTVAWQATTMAAVGVLIGVPLGLIVGRLVWQSVAEGIGVVSTPDVPVGLFVVVALVTIALANLVAAVPAWVAARTRPAVVLRSE